MTTALAALNSSERQDWGTPGWFQALVRRAFAGEIRCDPATSHANPTGALSYYTQDRPALGVPGCYLGPCGLRGQWSPQRTFINPPYGAHLSGEIAPDAEIKRKNKTTGLVEVVGIGTGWGKRIARHWDEGGEALALVGTRHSTEWWEDMAHAAHVGLLWRSRQFGGRIRFVHPETGAPGPQPNLESTVFYAGPVEGVGRFVETFGPHGRLFRGGKR